MSELQIEVGKKYKSRDGRRWTILTTERPDQVYKVVIMGESGELGLRTLFGRMMDGDAVLPGDLIAPWIDKPEFDRALLPKWKAIAMGPGGKWFAFTCVPHIAIGCVGWDGPNHMARYSLPPELLPKWSGDWKDSLLVFED